MYLKPLGDLSDLLESIAEGFFSSGRDLTHDQVRMVGLMFARPNSPLAKAEIIPQISDWHFRSGKNIDIYFAGYAKTDQHLPDPLEVQIPGAKSWWYSSESFDRSRRLIEDVTNWKYGGSCELLLTNSYYYPASKEVEIPFKCTVCCQLDVMKFDQAIISVERFLESIFRFSENFAGNDPTWGFSDTQGLGVTGSSIKQAVLSLLPDAVGQGYRKAEHFAVKDISKRPNAA